MNPKLPIAIFLLLLPILVFGQENEGEETPDSTSNWTRAGSMAVNFSNVGLSNWAGGGQNSISIGTVINLNADRETERSLWKNNLKFQFGMARVGSGDTNLFKKTDDLLNLSSNYAYKLSKRWSISALADFRTQVANGNTYRRDPVTDEEEVDQVISRFMAPGYLQSSFSMQYQNKYLTVGISPLASKFTFVFQDSLSDIGAFGVEPGERTRAEWAGAALNAKFAFSPMENIQFESTLGLFANYENMANTDVNWDTLLAMKVNKYISASFGTTLIYDHDVKIPRENGEGARPATQFRHVLNVGFALNF